MIIKWTEKPGVVHEFDWSGTPRTQEMRWLKERTGWTTKKFLEALEELDPDAVIGLICILSRREGRLLKWDDVDIDPATDLEWIPTEDEKKLIEAEAAKEAAKSGKALLPPVPELSPVLTTGQIGNGALSGAALSPKSEPILSNSGEDSGSTT